MNTKHLRIIRLVDHYGIPLRFAKQFSKYSDWKERAGLWQREEDPAKLTHVYKPKKHPDRSVEGCQGMTNQGNRCRVKDTTAHTHEDKKLGAKTRGARSRKNTNRQKITLPNR